MEKNYDEIFKKLSLKFPDAKCELNFSNNFELLVAVVLSAQCTDKRVNQVTKCLFAKYPTPKKLSNAILSELENEIHSCGLYKNKAKNLISLSKQLVEKYNSNVPKKFEDLISLDGVGRKTANVVLAVGFNEQTIAVDTHVFRVSNRLGIANAKRPIETEISLQKHFKKNQWSQLHYFLVLFGRYFCKSKKPLCNDCEFKEICTKN